MLSSLTIVSLNVSTQLNSTQRDLPMSTVLASGMRITTNNVPRDILHAWNLTLAELSEFDYLIDKPDNATDEELQQLWYDCGASFFRYRGEVYDMGEFMRIEPNSVHFEGWDGYRSDSFLAVCLFGLWMITKRLLSLCILASYRQ